ncbi:MAG: TM0996/MTH895 family glutaredoxin-like protein [Bacteroidales bacterium]|nr:TM0996/MTH895 family glutaredoxin-like protein [Bacteroidales bacterium]
MEIIILGTGCPKCKTLEKMTRETVSRLSVDASISKEEDIMNIMSYGIMHTPGLVVDGKVVMSGRLPSEKELVDLLTIK